MTAPNLPATVSDEYGTGLEDIEGEVGAVPRIGINHKGGTFKDTLSGEEFAEIVGVPLGVIKQRVMWDPDVENDNKKPWCKSNDAKTGYPNPSSERDGGFPWSDAKGLDPNTQPKDEFGRTIIACDSCPFAEWGRHPKTGKSTPPPCKERYTIPVVYNREGTAYDPPYMDSGIVAFQGASITPIKRYLTAFVRNKLPLYSAVVRLKLNMQKRGSVDYSVVEATKVAEVPRDDWEMYARDLPTLREYLTKPPRPDDDGSDPTRGHGQSAAQAAANAGVATGTVSVAPEEPVEADVVETPVQSSSFQPSTPVDDDDDDIPF